MYRTNVEEYRKWLQCVQRSVKEFQMVHMVVERAMKPVTNQRKDSLFYCSESGVRNAATFNTFILNCKLVGVPFMSYFKKVINEL